MNEKRSAPQSPLDQGTVIELNGTGSPKSLLDLNPIKTRAGGWNMVAGAGVPKSRKGFRFEKEVEYKNELENCIFF